MFNKKIIVIVIAIILIIAIIALVIWLSVRSANQPIITTEPTAGQSEVEQGGQLVSQPSSFEPTNNETGLTDTTVGTNIVAEGEATIIGDYFLATYQFFIGPDKDSQSLLTRVRGDSQLDRLSYQINKTETMEQTDIQKVFNDCAKVNYNYQPWPILCDCVRQKCYFSLADIKAFLAELTK